MGIATVPSRDYQVGETTLTVPQSKLDFDHYRIALTRENWPQGVDCVLENGAVQSNVVVQIIFERSDDGGSTWKHAGSGTFQGGAGINPHTGLPVLNPFIGFDARDARTNVIVKQTGLLRVTARVLVPIRTAVTVMAVESA